MPSKIDIYQIGVWFCVGFFTGAGWAIAGVARRADLYLLSERRPDLVVVWWRIAPIKAITSASNDDD